MPFLFKKNYSPATGNLRVLYVRFETFMVKMMFRIGEDLFHRVLR